jgi:hypothetical protein
MSDTFLIPVGTQVVLRYAHPMPHAPEPKPAGSVGVVVDAPQSNDRAYLVRFVDGQELTVKFGELLVRKRDAADVTVTPGPDVSRFVVLRVVLGSRAFGLSTDSSDEDRRGVYLPPADWHWSLVKPPEQVESFAPGVEEVVWELEKFLRLALQANPNILEVLWSPLVRHADGVGTELRELRTAFLSKRLFQTYSGYVLSQFRLMRKGFAKSGTFKVKHAMHLLRLLHSGTHAMRERDIRVDVADHREELLAVRRGERTFDEVAARALQLNAHFEAAYSATALPEKPDFERVNAFLIAARRRAK